ncbi:transposable element Tcb2 transposase [Trichonephila clavipes]|uniref:Transposable element Tcb2 transposase n=1 Tax=Trichonephila clavipes TaxID=2585209 RepID=A0A8X6V6R0_TRICX|nr:transposable element Tcb2 transposase [Trichonephila clavipes]
MQWLSGALFQQHNARPQTARVSQDYLRTVTSLPWPARSPDLSPIEHIWDYFERHVGHPTNLNELEDSNQWFCVFVRRYRNNKKEFTPRRKLPP